MTRDPVRQEKIERAWWVALAVIVILVLALAGCADYVTMPREPAPKPKYDRYKVPCDNIIHNGVPICAWTLEVYGKPGVG